MIHDTVADERAMCERVALDFLGWSKFQEGAQPFWLLMSDSGGVHGEPPGVTWAFYGDLFHRISQDKTFRLLIETNGEGPAVYLTWAGGKAFYRGGLVRCLIACVIDYLDSKHGN